MLCVVREPEMKRVFHTWSRDTKTEGVATSFSRQGKTRNFEFVSVGSDIMDEEKDIFDDIIFMEERYFSFTDEIFLFAVEENSLHSGR